MEKLFGNYINAIDEILEKGNSIQSFSSQSNRLPNYLNKALVLEGRNTVGVEAISYNEKNKVLIEFDENHLEKLFGRNRSKLDHIAIGSHPDFENIQHFEFENHYCVTMFMDIVGSTRLNEKYSLQDIRKIKDTILTLAIKVAHFFGGHIHRLQGDGIMLQFVRRGQKESDAVINALNTASVLAQFISTDLSTVFEKQGIKPLRVRVGVDLGFKEDVIWSHYGLIGCSELTTTSLHTDLAAKLQAQSKSNGIYIGGNIKEILDLNPDFLNDILDENGQIDYYIYKGNQNNYRKYNFNWQKYLKTFDFIRMNNSNLEFNIPHYRLKCTLHKEDQVNEYFQNSYSIQKGIQIKFELLENNLPYRKKDFEIIEWKIYNFGKEATNNEILILDGDKNSISCTATSAYKGHHYVECTLKRTHLTNQKVRFSVFVD